MLSSVMQRLNDRRDGAADLGEDAGFTLIELMVVLLILAILLAIAIPTFLGVTGGANDRAAQSNLNTALTTAKAAAAQQQPDLHGHRHHRGCAVASEQRAQHQLAARRRDDAGSCFRLHLDMTGTASCWPRGRRTTAAPASTPPTTRPRSPQRRHPHRWR